MTTVITGASAGIGEELAVQLAADGHPIALLARRGDELERVAERARGRAREHGHADLTVTTHPVDVTDREAMHRILGELQAQSPIETLILNAGIGDNTDVARFDDRTAARILEVNSVSATYALGAVLPRMVERGRGRIVGISSIAAYRGMPGAAAYCASKACLTALLQSIRIDCKRHGVRVTTVSPGFVRTAMTDKNQHAMPFLLEVDAAVAKIVRGMKRGAREVRFPWPLVAVAVLIRALPDGIYEWLASRYRRPQSLPLDTDLHAGADGDG